MEDDEGQIGNEQTPDLKHEIGRQSKIYMICTKMDCREVDGVFQTGYDWPRRSKVAWRVTGRPGRFGGFGGQTGTQINVNKTEPVFSRWLTVEPSPSAPKSPDASQSLIESLIDCTVWIRLHPYLEPYKIRRTIYHGRHARSRHKRLP
jgi:hypothetical protein